MQTIMPPNDLTPDTNRRPSGGIWGRCPWEDIMAGKKNGFAFFDDFVSLPGPTPTTTGVFGPYKGFSSTGGTILPATQALGGIITLGSDGDDEGAVLASATNPFKIIQGGGKLWFECRVKVDTIADTKYDAFIGLGESMTISATVPITATAGTLADQNIVGFHRPATDGDVINAVYKANGVTAVTVGVMQVPAADTYYKLGFVFDPYTYVLTFYLNGVATLTKTIPSAAGTDFPNDVLLGLIAAVVNAAGSVTSVFTVDWWKAAQMTAPGDE